jgi:uncharacterized protein YggE
VVGAALLVAGMGVAGCGSSSTSADKSCSSGSPQLTLHGTGRADAPPDLLTVVVAVDVSGPTAKAALDDNNAKTAALTTAFTTGGVAAKDVQTSGLTIEPEYSFPRNQPPKLTGYHVTDQITAKLRDLGKAGGVIDAAASAAGDAIRINSLMFSIEDPSALHDQARANAVRSVVQQAKATAGAADQHLGRICSIRDDAPTPTAPGFETRTSLSSDAAAAVPISPGSVETDSTVTVVYALAG